MPEFEQALQVPGRPAETLLLLSMASFKELGWTLEFAVGHRLVGYTKKTWNRHHDHIIIDAEDGLLQVKSQLPQSASWDLLKKNQKNVRRFGEAFSRVQAAGTDPEALRAEWTELLQKTEEAVDQEMREQAEVDSVMNLSSGSRLLTYLIIGLNFLVFGLMAVKGVSLFDPTVEDLYVWGGNYKPATLNGQAWRLLSSVFVHSGLIHLLFNMYALYIVGAFLEPMVGKWRFAAAYLSTGLIASLASIWWFGDRVVSVGASGAVFGLFGVFLALLFTRLIPAKMRNSLLQSIGIFLVFNLAYGAAKPGIDNAAHIGGLLSGLLIGTVYYFSFRSARVRPALAALVPIVLAAVLTVLYVNGVFQ